MAKVATRSIATSTEGSGNKVRGWWDQSSNFLRDVRNEMRKVTSPSMKEVRATTGVVIVTVALFAIYFYGIDKIIGSFIDYLFSHLK